MKLRNKASLIVFAGLFIFALAFFAIIRHDPVELRWKLKPGQVLKYQCNVSSTISTTGKDESSKLAESVYYLSVIDLNREGIATIFKAEKGPVSKETMATFRMDPLENPYQMNPYGRVVRDIVAYRNDIKRLLPQVPEGSWRRFFQEEGQGNLAQYQDLKSLEDFLLPEHGVRPGDEWHRTITVTNERGRFQITHVYKLEKVKEDLAYITMFQSETLIPGSETDFGATMKVTQQLTRRGVFAIGQGILVDFQEEKRTTIVLGSGGTESTTRMSNRRTESIR